LLPNPELQRNASPSVGASVTNGIPVASIKTGNRLCQVAPSPATFTNRWLCHYLNTPFCKAIADTLQSEAVFSRCQQLSDAIKAESAVSAAKAADVLLSKL
jgi:hypothetical protein